MSAGDDLRWWDVLGFLGRRRRSILRAFLIGLGLGAVATVALPPVYRASTTVTEDKVPPVVVLDQPGFANHTNVVSVDQTAGVQILDIATLAEMARSRTVRDGAVARLAPVMGERASRAVLRGLRAKPMGQTQLLLITVDNRDPRVAAEAANAVAAALVEMDLAARRSRATELRKAIQQQLRVAVPKLHARENALTAFKAKHGDIALANQTSLDLSKLTQLEAQLVDLRLQREEAQARIAASRGRLASQARITPTQWMPSPLITTLQNQLAAQEIEFSGMRRQFTAKYPAVLAAEAKIQATKRRLNSELARSLQAGQYGVDPVYQQTVQQLRQDEIANVAYDARGRALTDAIQQYEKRMRELPARELQQVRLIRATKEAEEIHQILSEKLQQARIAEASIGSAIRAVDPAWEPEHPVRPRALPLLLGGVLGLLVGMGGAVVKERIHDPLTSAEDAERVLGAPALGLIPELPPVDRRPAEGAEGPPPLLTSPVWYLFPGVGSSDSAWAAAERKRSAFAEAFRYLRTNLFYLHKDPLQTLLITSPGPREAQDIVAANLAIAIAQTGQRVWLMDCDLREPVLDRAWAFQDFRHEKAVGLADVLAGGVSTAEALHRTAIDNLWFLPAGTKPTNPAELLGSQQMRAVLQQGRNDADVLVLNAPPVLPVTDAAVLAAAVEEVLLVVHIGTTPREAAYRAYRQLQAIGARMIGVVTTGTPHDGFRYYGNECTSYYGSEPSGIWHFGAGWEPSSGK